MIKVGIIGILGYAGEELLKILSRHPKARACKLCDKAVARDKSIRDIYPEIVLPSDLKLEELNLPETISICDVVFLAIPHGESVAIVAEIIKNGKRAIDLSADFRLKDAGIYAEWYNLNHTHHELLKTAVYGLPELYNSQIAGAQLLANPGCYPTTAMLGLAPLLSYHSDSIDLSSIIIDSCSGVSGGGRNFARAYFQNEHPNHKPYNIAGLHRHIPEIEQELTRITSNKIPIKITFTPRIIPVERGMLSTIYINLKQEIIFEKLLKNYAEFYKNSPFIKFFENDKLPSIKDVVNTNFCCIAVRIDKRTNRVVIVSAIDNLIKGAAGQAVQNMNIMFGLDETEGIL